MKRRVLIGALACGVAGYWAYNTFSTHETPKGQPPLTELENPSPLVQTFNDSASQYRVIALLSPT
ncbi:MAG: hypothetical protein HY820_29350 [Acidobacteria bacterium]|nr:hypothetical protein [Acidobacteriota bacterium]